MAPEQLVRAAFAALDRRRCTVTPGLSNRLLALTPRLAGRQTVARIAERTMRPRDRPQASAGPAT
jgi:short-subunit dehydrogenase